MRRLLPTAASCNKINCDIKLNFYANYEYLLLCDFSFAVLRLTHFDRLICLWFFFALTPVFALGENFTVLFVARALQGIGSACSSVSGEPTMHRCTHA